MSEEVRKAKSAVPRAMLWSIFMNGVLGYAMVMVILVSMGTAEDALSSSSPIIAILQNVTGSIAATTAMVTGLFVISFSINLANIASVSRLTWACGRDGVLPKQLAFVSNQSRGRNVLLMENCAGRSKTPCSDPISLVCSYPRLRSLFAQHWVLELCSIWCNHCPFIYRTIHIVCDCYQLYAICQVF